MLGTRTRKKAHRGLLYCTSCILLWSRCLSNYLFLQFQDSYKTQNPTSNMEKGQTQGGLFTVQQQDGQCPAEEVNNFLSDYQRKNRNYQVVAYFANTSVTHVSEITHGSCCRSHIKLCVVSLPWINKSPTLAFSKVDKEK